jgi:hypothetical protein
VESGIQGVQGLPYMGRCINNWMGYLRPLLEHRLTCSTLVYSHLAYSILVSYLFRRICCSFCIFV